MGVSSISGTEAGCICAGLRSVTTKFLQHVECSRGQMNDTDIDDQEVLEQLTHDDSTWAVFEEVLGEMTPIYHEDAEWLDIVRSNISHAKPGGEEIGVQADLPMEMDPEVTGPDVLRLLDDLCAHEVEHVNASDLTAKKEFIEQYPNFGQLAGQVFNIFEDEYIDMRRKRRFYGMRSKLAYYVWLHMNTAQRAPPVGKVQEQEGLANALVTGLLQVALAGYMNGEPSDTVKDAMARIEPLLDRVRECDDADRREVLAHGAVQILLRYIPDPDEYDGDEIDDRKRATGGDRRELDDESPSDGGDPRIEMDDDTKEAVEEMLEEMMEDDEVPDPLPDGADPEVKVDPDEIDVDPPEAAGEDSTDDIEEKLEDAMDAAESLEDALDDADSMDELDEEPATEDMSDAGDDEAPDPDGDMPDMGGDSSADGSGESGESESGDGERDGEVDDETIDPLGDDAGGSGGDSEGEASEPARDIEELLAEYDTDSLVVTNQ